MSIDKRIEAIESIVQTAASQTSGLLGLGFKDLASGASVFHNGDTRLPSASTFKIPVLIEFHRQAAAGLLDPDEMHTLLPEEVAPGSGVLCCLTPGLTMRWRDYAGLMMIVSDNTATDVTFSRLGQENILAQIRRMGLPDTRSDLNCRALICRIYGVPEDMPAEDINARFRTNDYEFHGEYYERFDMPNDFSSPADMAKMFTMLWE